MSEDQAATEETDPVVAQREHIKRLEEQLRDKAGLERKVAFLEAGVDISSKAGAYFVKGYEGELDAEAIRAEAEELGLVRGGAPAADTKPDPEVNESEAESTGARRDMSAGGEPGTDKGPAPQKRAMDVGERVVKEGGTAEEAIAAAFGELAFAGYKDNDPRAFVK